MRVAIVGYDVEGQASYRYFERQGAEITIFDEARAPRATPPEGVQVISGETALEQLEQMEPFDIVMRTPGLDPKKLSEVKNVSSATQEFFAQCPASIIGVTGTKGKGTTCSFITSILKAAGETVHLVGNIGTPALDVLPDIKPQDVVVYELSSFQLWDATKSPHVAVVLMIEPDHLDVHASMNEYVAAKSNICRWQKTTDTVIYNPDNKLSEQIANSSNAVKLAYTKAPAAHVKNGRFYINEQELCSTSTVVIPGKHNIDNACASITAAWQFVRDPDAVAKGLSDFEGLPHRLKRVNEVSGVVYYDDSIATTPGSAIAAIRAFAEPKILIVGGSDKGADFSQLARLVAEPANEVSHVVCIGEMGPAIAALLRAHNYKNIIDIQKGSSMNDIVQTAHAAAKPGDVVILSPACASFDMFKSYSDRGDQFIAAVQNLS